VVTTVVLQPPGPLHWFAAVVLEPQGHCNSNHYIGFFNQLALAAMVPHTTSIQSSRTVVVGVVSREEVS
jgi:hypothetical protein